MRLFRRSPSLPPPPEGQDDFWATVHVILHQPLFEEGPDEDPDPAVGYYRNFGLRAAPASIATILEGAIDDGRIDWAGTEWYPVDWSTLDKPIRRQIEYVEGNPVWYLSGHIYYTADEDEEESPPS